MTINKKLTTKDIAFLSMCSLRTAQRIKAEIRKTFNCKNVLVWHYNAYYNILTLGGENEQK